jgi:uridine phosphorylase
MHLLTFAANVTALLFMSNDFIPASELILNPDGSIYHLCLKPGEVASIIITVGDQDRVAQVARHFSKIEFERQHREFKTITGTFAGTRLTVVSTGIGTDNIDIVLNELDALFQVDFATRKLHEKLTPLRIVRIGTSGALQEDIPINSFLVSSHALAFDRLLAFYGSSRFDEPANWPVRLAEITPHVTRASAGLLRNIPASFLTGITATMPGFYGPQGRHFRLGSVLTEHLEDIRNLHIDGQRVTNLEMETSGIYGLASIMGHEAISFNAILANRITGEFSAQPQKTVDELIEIVLDWLITQ